MYTVTCPFTGGSTGTRFSMGRDVPLRIWMKTHTNNTFLEKNDPFVCQSPRLSIKFSPETIKFHKNFCFLLTFLLTIISFVEICANLAQIDENLEKWIHSYTRIV